MLTSLSAEAVAEAWGRGASLDVEAEVLRLAEIAAEAGADGVVCGGSEARAVSQRFGDRLSILVPGVRAAGGGLQDQARVVTPREAAAAGARYVVVGRMVTGASDRRQAMQAVGLELGVALAEDGDGAGWVGDYLAGSGSVFLPFDRRVQSCLLFKVCPETSISDARVVRRLSVRESSHQREADL